MHHSGLEWRAENKRSSVNHDAAEWSGPIPMWVPPSSTGVSPHRVRSPSDPSATMCIEVYASFELQSMLGAGEQLRELTITVEQLLEHSAKDVREWDGIFTWVWVLTACQYLPSSQRMGTLYPRVHPSWLLSTGSSARAMIHQRQIFSAHIA